MRSSCLVRALREIPELVPSSTDVFLLAVLRACSFWS